jgi:hypothetical protein
MELNTFIEVQAFGDFDIKAVSITLFIKTKPSISTKISSNTILR